MKKGLCVIIAFWCMGSWGCQEDESDSVWFQSMPSKDSGIEFSNPLTSTDSINIIQYLYFYNGSGVATGDVNNDGLPDIFFGGNEVDSKLYLNRTEDGNIKFEDVSDQVGLSNIDGWTTGVTITDVNGDGLHDLYICQVNYKSIKGRNLLYINQGIKDGLPSYAEKGASYGIDFQGLSTQSAFFDYDLDGDLDMYLLTHSVHSTDNYTKADIRYRSDSEGDKLYRNDGESFTDVTGESGILSSKVGFGLGLGISDVDKDGYPDIYVGNDFHENDYFYLNNGDGTFQEVITEAVGHTSQFTMGMDIADINNDLYSDILTMDMMPEDEQVRLSSVPPDNYDIYLFKHNFGYHHQLPRNNLQLFQGIDSAGIPNYSEIAQLLDIDDTDWSWSPLVADFDNDGWKDLYVTNGIVKRPNDLDYLNYISSPLVQKEATDLEMIDQMPEGKVKNYLFKNNGDYSFENISSQILENPPSTSTGAAYADFDNDGDLDIITNNINEEAQLLVNQSGPNSITISFKGNNQNSEGVGCKVTAYAGDDQYYVENYPIVGFMSSSAGDQIIGIGDNLKIDSLIVYWPTGNLEKLVDIAVGGRIELNQSDAQSYLHSSTPTQGEKLIELVDIGLDFVHQENNYVDASTQKMIPWMLSQRGPSIAKGDVNDDSLDDVFVGGAIGQAGALFIQTATGNFKKVESEELENDKHFEDTDALFIDADGDGDQDLYVVSAGNEYLEGSPFILDRLYLNDGQGNFKRKVNALPLITENGSSISAADYDGDGDVDLVMGSQVMSGNYGSSKGGYVLQNDGSGKFADVTGTTAPGLRNIGMISDLSWGDVDGDGDQDIVICGEWIPIVIFENEDGVFQRRIVPNSVGIWNHLNLQDVNGDNQLDIIGGNLGLNSHIARPGTGLVVGDFDRNVVSDPIVVHTKEDKKYPVPGRDLLISQMNFFRNVHKDYSSFASSTFEEMFGPVLGNVIANVGVEEFETSVYVNEGGFKFSKRSLPIEVQFSPIMTSVVTDADGDGQDELIIGGNISDVSPYIGRLDGGVGSVIDMQNGIFKQAGESNDLLIREDVRDMEVVNVKGVNHLIVSINNGPLKTYRLSTTN